MVKQVIIGVLMVVLVASGFAVYGSSLSFGWKVWILIPLAILFLNAAATMVATIVSVDEKGRISYRSLLYRYLESMCYGRNAVPAMLGICRLHLCLLPLTLAVVILGFVGGFIVWTIVYDIMVGGVAELLKLVGIFSVLALAVYISSKTERDELVMCACVIPIVVVFLGFVVGGGFMADASSHEEAARYLVSNIVLIGGVVAGGVILTITCVALIWYVVVWLLLLFFRNYVFKNSLLKNSLIGDMVKTAYDKLCPMIPVESPPANLSEKADQQTS